MFQTRVLTLIAHLICLSAKPVSMKIYWFYSDFIKVIMDLVLYAFILIAKGS
jgi:hypothetical protein